MLRRWVWLTMLAAVMAVVFAIPRSARAETGAHSLAVAVLSLDSDDAEEQADALTGALKSRIRNSQGWSLIETSQSLGMLTAALRCPGKPVPAECEQKIGEQIKSERYIFGYLTKGPQSGQVTAEIHLYQKSKPDTVIRESYADNLKDQNDESLRKIAQRMLDRLGGNAVGVIVVRMGSESGEVIVDGDKRVPLTNGTARLELSPGSHSVEVAVTGQSPQKRNVLVTAGKETVVDLAVAPTGETKPDKPFPTRKVLGGSLFVLGIGAAVFSLYNLGESIGDQKDAEDHQNAPENPSDPRLPAGKKADDVCGVDPRFTDSSTMCKADSDATKHQWMAGIAGGVGAVLLFSGAYLYLTAGSSEESAALNKANKKTPPRLVPSIGSRSAGLVLSGSF